MASSSSADVIEVHSSSVNSTALPTNRSLRSRAATTAPTNNAVSTLAAGSRSSAPVKRPRSPEESPGSLTGTGGGGESDPKRARDAFFDSLVQAGGSTSEGSARTRVIAGPDDLYQYELRQCFDILHACGQATQKYASLATTRKSIEGFLTAIFNGFDGADEKPPDKPEMSFSVEASAPVGRICVLREAHRGVENCISSLTCQEEVRVTASCSSPPTSLCLDFWRHDALHNRSEKISPADRADIRWMATSWRAELRAELEDRITARIHRHNKYVALWHARVLIRGWTRGLSASEADSGGGAGWAYVGTEAVSMALMLLGDSK